MLVLISHPAKGLSCALSSQDHRSHPTLVFCSSGPHHNKLREHFCVQGLQCNKSRQLYRIFLVYITGVNAVKKRALFTTQPLPSTLKLRHRQASNPAYAQTLITIIKQGSRGRGRGGSQSNCFPKPNCNSA